MYSFLKEQNTRPPVFSVYTADQLWTEPHIAEQMLAYHLNPDLDLASRNHGLIERSVDWLTQRFDLSSGKRVLDLGCGPGLYSNKLASLGAKVTGVDFSVNSLEHARSIARRDDLDVEYLRANYLDLDVPGTFDLVMLIFGDFCALSPSQRQTLLAFSKKCLAPGGRLVFDVFSIAQFDELEEETRYETEPSGGFWSPDPYFLFSTRFKYGDERVYLDRHTLVEEAGCRELFNWIQCYDPEGLDQEMAEYGWDLHEVLGNIAGDEYDSCRKDFAVVARPSA